MELSEKLYQAVITTNLHGKSQQWIQQWITDDLFEPCNDYITTRSGTDPEQNYLIIKACFQQWDIFCDLLQSNPKYTSYAVFFRMFSYKEALIKKAPHAWQTLENLYGNK